jgi:plasmid stabilization system protein ParE
MNYRLVVQPSALADLDEAYRWIARRSPNHADSWFNGFVDALNSLKTMPERCELAPESRYIGVKICQMLYGKRGAFIALFLPFVDAMCMSSIFDTPRAMQ